MDEPELVQKVVFSAPSFSLQCNPHRAGVKRFSVLQRPASVKTIAALHKTAQECTPLFSHGLEPSSQQRGPDKRETD